MLRDEGGDSGMRISDCDEASPEGEMVNRSQPGSLCWGGDFSWLQTWTDNPKGQFPIRDADKVTCRKAD